MKPILAFYGIPDRFNHQYPGYTHDHNLALLVDGKIEFYCHLERYTRRKNDNRLHLFLEELLDKEVDLKEEFDIVSVNSFVGQSFISKTGRLRVEPNVAPIISHQTQQANGWYQASPWKGFKPKCRIVSHELAHIFSCLPFFGTFKENSLLIHFDGGASQSNFSAFTYKNGKLELLEYHWELSHLSKIFNDNALSFALMQAKPGEHCSVPGKLMGYAAMGTAKEDLMGWLQAHNYFKDCWNDFDIFYQAAQNYSWNGDLKNNKDPFLMDIAASLQAIFQKAILQKISNLQQSTKTDYLYYTGGCALNIMTNSKIIASNLFRDVFIPPACNDSGLALGAAALLNWENQQNLQSHSPYLNFQNNNPFTTTSKETISEVAQLIMAGKIFGVCNGNGEAGPRALGNRSIIARADCVKIAQKVSQTCKGREWFRPIAPVMLERNAKRVTGRTNVHHLSKYMLLDFKIKDAFKSALEGVVHTNGTARIQTIYQRKENPFLYDLLDYLDINYGLKALINTSFNQKGEPMVQTATDAEKATKSMQLDGLILNGELKLYELEKYSTRRT